MFVAGKLLTMVMLPTALMVECVLIGVLLRRRRAGRVLLALGAAALAACLVLPVDRWAIRPLEDRFPAVAAPPARVDGIVMLGGAIDDLTSRDRGTPTLTAAANRVTSFVILARRYPRAKLVFTGGSGDLQQGIANEARWMRMLLDQLGLPPGRVAYENRSRTTWENAVYSFAMAAPRPGERWVLLTSASHMPRAVGVFRAAGWTVLPWPVGYQSRDRITGYAPSLGQKLALLDWAAHEWLGLLGYDLAGGRPARVTRPPRPPPADTLPKNKMPVMCSTLSYWVAGPTESGTGVSSGGSGREDRRRRQIHGCNTGGCYAQDYFGYEYCAGPQT